MPGQHQMPWRIGSGAPVCESRANRRKLQRPAEFFGIHLRQCTALDPSDRAQSEQQGGLKAVACPDGIYRICGRRFDLNQTRLAVPWCGSPLAGGENILSAHSTRRAKVPNMRDADTSARSKMLPMSFGIDRNAWGRNNPDDPITGPFRRVRETRREWNERCRAPPSRIR
jgi:hypothetical protein